MLFEPAGEYMVRRLDLLAGTENDGFDTVFRSLTHRDR